MTQRHEPVPGDWVVPALHLTIYPRTFKRTPRKLQRCERRPRRCRGCGAAIQPGDLYALKDTLSPLCVRCVEPEGAKP